MPKKTLCICAALALFGDAAPTLALSDEAIRRLEILAAMSLEDLMKVEIVVAGPSKFAQPVMRAPASVTVITAQEIRQYGYRTLGEILESVPGLDVTDDMLYQYAGVRGFSRSGDFSSRLLVLLDGRRLNDNVYENAPLALDFPLDVDLIEQVEVARGPASALYGANAVFGIVNVVTRAAGQMRELKLSAQDDRHYAGRATGGGTFGEAGRWLLSASRHDYPGSDVFYPAVQAVAHRRDAEEVDSALGKLVYGPWRLTAAYSDRAKGAGNGYSLALFDSPSQAADTHSYANLGYAGDLGAWEVRADVSYHRMDYHGRYLYAGADRGLAQALDPNLSDSAGRWWSAEFSAAREFGRHHWIAGLEYQYNQTQTRVNYFLSPYQLQTQAPLQNRCHWAVFAQDDVALGAHLSLSAALRYDASCHAGNGDLSPRLALIYQPSPSTALKLLFGEAFRAPTAFELSYAPADEAPQAERIHAHEISLEHRFGDEWVGLASLYRNHLSGLLGWTHVPGTTQWFITDAGEFTAHGLELALQGRHGDWSGRLSYAYQDTEPSDPARLYTNAPAHLLKFHLAYRLNDRYSLGWRTYFSSTRDTGREEGATLPAYSTSHLSLLGRPWQPGLEIGLHVHNVFDQDYSYPADFNVYPHIGLPQPGRTWRISLDYRF